MFRFLVPLLFIATGLAGEEASRAGGDIWLSDPFFAEPVQAQAFDCSRATCTQIRSCEEACYKLRVCGHSRRDGDNDGIPCENLCSRRC